jgi:hypothetical protein
MIDSLTTQVAGDTRGTVNKQLTSKNKGSQASDDIRMEFHQGVI